MGLYANVATARVSLRRVAEVLDTRIDVAEWPAPRPWPDEAGDVNSTT
jgi:hypothetical protein